MIATGAVAVTAPDHFSKEHKLMTTLNETAAAAHPAYADALRTACRRAFEDMGECFSVYWDGAAVYVRGSYAVPPPDALQVCIAQWWQGRTVQLRFKGARSEWVTL